MPKRPTDRNNLHYSLLFLAILPFILSCHQENDFHATANTHTLIPEGFVSVAHRGYHPRGVAENSAEAYRYAKLAGFDYGETDIQWTKDNIPVCCHNDFFLDNYSKEKVVIPDHTLEELKSKYFYHYGSKISSLEEVLVVCKEMGLGLYIDHFDFYEGEREAKIYSLIKHFGKEKVCYLFDTLNKRGIDQVMAFDPKATIVLVWCDKMNNNLIEFANEIKTDSNKVILDLTFLSNPISKLVSNYQQLKEGIGYGVWTVNDHDIFNHYRPYVESITSDSLSH